jgi:hypothetical protein
MNLSDIILQQVTKNVASSNIQIPQNLQQQVLGGLSDSILGSLAKTATAPGGLDQIKALLTGQADAAKSPVTALAGNIFNSNVLSKLKLGAVGAALLAFIPKIMGGLKNIIKDQDGDGDVDLNDVLLTLKGGSGSILGSVLGGVLGGGAAKQQKASTGGLGSILGGVLNSGTVTNVLLDVIGLNKLAATEIVGTWRYVEPGVAFTSEGMLQKAGGQVISGTIKEKILPTYTSLGVTSANTYFTFGQDGQFSASVLGRPLQGTYTFDSSTGTIQLKTLLLSTPAYLTRTSTGMSLTFQSKKLLQAVQIIGAASGNQTLGAISEIASSYDGIRLGFDLAR